MGHPVGTHINLDQDHELNYWLNDHGFRETDENRKLLIKLIGKAKDYNSKKQSDHLLHDELNEYYKSFSASFCFEPKKGS